MRLYIAGPMRGCDRFNFPAFDRACQELRAMGHIPLGPQEFDRLCGIDEYVLTDKDITPQQMKNFMARDLSLIILEADGVVVLPGWRMSKGALTEVCLARTIGIPVYDHLMNELDIHLIQAYVRYPSCSRSRILEPAGTSEQAL